MGVLIAAFDTGFAVICMRHVKPDAPLWRFITLICAKVGRGGSNVAGKSMIPNDKHNEWRRGVHADEWIWEAVNGGGGGSEGGQKVIKEGRQTTEEVMFGQNKSKEDCAIGIRGEGNNRRVVFYHKNTQTNGFCRHAEKAPIVMCMTNAWRLLKLCVIWV